MNEPILHLGKISFWGRSLWRLNSPAIPAPSDAHRKKILIVDDDAILLKTVSLKLSPRYVVVTATDASSAISALRDEKPDLILLDLNFPPDIANGGRVTWDGFQIMSWLRGFREAEHLPFIIITGGDPAIYKQEALDSGAIAFFHKPIDHDDLLPVIESTLG